MTDLTERLRTSETTHEAADHIEQLEAVNHKMRGALASMRVALEPIDGSAVYETIGVEECVHNVLEIYYDWKDRDEALKKFATGDGVNTSMTGQITSWADDG